VHLPTNAQLARPGALSIDLIGEKASVEAAVKELSTLSVALLTGSRKVDVDHLRHRAIQTKGAKKYATNLPQKLSLIIFSGLSSCTNPKRLTSTSLTRRRNHRPYFWLLIHP
jgi:hypothetical protein